MKVLVLNQHYWPEIAATGQLLQDICEDLAEAGHAVTVVCGQPSYRVIDGIPARMPSTERHRGVTVYRVASYVPERRTIPRRVLHYCSYFSSSLLRILRVERPDVALVMSSPPLLLGLSGALLTALRGVPFVYSVQDIYPDVAINLGVVRRGAFSSVLERISARLYQSAARVVTLSDDMASRLVGHGVVPERLAVIPNWADTDALKPMPRQNAFARKHGLADRFVVQYAGNVGLSQGLETLIEAAAQLRDLPITFVIAGDGNAREQLEQKARHLGCDRVVFLPPQLREHLPELLASCDVGLVCTKRGVGKDLVPSKLYGIMAAARPVLASVEESSEVARVLREYRCGHVVEPESADALAMGIRTLFLNQKDLPAMGAAGRIACETHFSRKRCTKLYGTVLHQAAAGLSVATAPVVGTRTEQVSDHQA